MSTADRSDAAAAALVTPPRTRPSLSTLVPPGASPSGGLNPPPSANVSFASGTTTGSTDGGHRVLRRLSALFHHSEGPEFTPSTEPLESPIASDDEFAIAEPEPIEDRVGLKVLVVTWNMGDALPKGDLAVLLGDVPPYEPPPETDGGVPRLPLENKHPYHVVVFAAQECPTPSGVPRGLGGGVLKGAGLQKMDSQKHKEGKPGYTKEKEKEDKAFKDALSAKDKKTNGAAGKLTLETVKEGQSTDPGAVRTPADEALPAPPPVNADEATPERTSSPPLTPASLHSPHQIHRAPQGPKGWSAMLEEWLTAGPPQLHRTNPDHHPLHPSPLHGVGFSADGIETSKSALAPPVVSSLAGPPYPSPMSDVSPADTPLEPVPSTPAKPPAINIPSSSATTINRSSSIKSGLAAAAPISSSFKSSSLSSSFPFKLPQARLGQPVDGDNGLLSPPGVGELPRHLAKSPAEWLLTRSPSDKVLDRHIERPHEQFQVFRQPGAGPYVNVAKERLLGLYLSVFVFKGCEHLVQGVDKDYVTTGLAGGRFGNKGGIGISLNLGGHRLMFVNAHLAAHTDRNQARLDNIQKIKSELKLDCFLPPEDPRSQLDDITDRFDTVFWCGDLNFRVDISLLHAKWLLEQKRYNDALMFDQLKKAMEDPKTTPLPGFHEAPIDFMPTFKYDVWKSVRATNRELRRSLRKRKGDRTERQSMDSVRPSGGALEFVPEGDHEHEHDGDEPVRPVIEIPEESPTQNIADMFEAPLSPGVPTSPDMPEAPPDWHSEASRSSFYEDPNSADGFAQDGLSQSLASSSHMSSRASPAEPPRGRKPSFIKEKGRQMLGLLGIGRPAQQRGRTTSPNPAAYAARRTSLSSFRSLALSEDGQSAVSSDDGYPSTGAASASGDGSVHHKRTASNASAKLLSSPPRAAGGRRLTMLRRTVSGRSVRDDEAVEDDDFDDTVDNRVGVYDTSKKQRIPSWCDRVLWKSQIIPDDDDLGLARTETRSGLSRIGHALSNLVRRRSVSAFDGPPASHMLRSDAIPVPQANGTASGAPISFSPDSPFSASSSLSASPNLSLRRRLSSVPPDSPSRRRRESSVTSSISGIIESSPVPKPSRSRSVTFDGSAGAPAPRPEGIGLPRSNTLESQSSAKVTIAVPPPTTPASQVARPTSPRRASTGALPASPSSRRSSISLTGPRRKSADPTPLPAPKQPPTHPLHKTRSTGHSMYDSHKGRDGAPLNTFARFLRDLPGRFHSRASIFHPAPEPAPEADDKPRRHLVGEVEVLHYGTIDDAGMRKLEGRSDHRPAIFSAAVYVD
ncbi:hypothetical protein Q8F55_002186 [Vanrija albida]|uniref:Inositol polyphosphate-related phosphatase domain-containing protein n=1 Tax=Vanrija albida TaxID=181172 RepID=A0ABR3Q929_9TREE